MLREETIKYEGKRIKRIKKKLNKNIYFMLKFTRKNLKSKNNDS